jgi:hypothetical protein
VRVADPDGLRLVRWAADQDLDDDRCARAWHDAAELETLRGVPRLAPRPDEDLLVDAEDLPGGAEPCTVRWPWGDEDDEEGRDLTPADAWGDEAWEPGAEGDETPTDAWGDGPWQPGPEPDLTPVEVWGGGP